MITINGAYTSAKLFLTNNKNTNIDPYAIAQLQALCDNPANENCEIVVMPDVHPGKVGTIGLTQTVEKAILPTVVGIDIGCGMELAQIKGRINEFQKLDTVIRERVPSGFQIRSKIHSMAEDFDFSELYCGESIRKDKALLSLGSLGSGNHFIEIGTDNSGNYFLVVHSGSRHLGKEVTECYLKAGQRELKNSIADLSGKQRDSSLKVTGTDKEQLKSPIGIPDGISGGTSGGIPVKISVEIPSQPYSGISRKVPNQTLSGTPGGISGVAPGRIPAEIPYELTFLTGSLMENYIHDLQIVQKFAALNRQIILREICKGMKWKIIDSYSCVHNYVESSDVSHNGRAILRKGAISAKHGERVIIPINMREGIILGTGLGNTEWNCSAPHGAGRIIKRSDVSSSYTLSAYKASMKGVYSSCICKETLDEAPFAYRGLQEISEVIEETVRIDKVIRPIYNFKSGSY